MSEKQKCLHVELDA